MTLAEMRQLLQQCKIKAISCEQVEASRFQAEIEYYPGDPRTLINKLYKAALVEDTQMLGSMTWQWNGPDELQTLWIRTRIWVL